MNSTERRRWMAGLVLVAGTYVHFLLFTEFALLELSGGAQAMGVMAALAVGGILGSYLAAWRLKQGGFSLGLFTCFMFLASLLAATAVLWASVSLAPIPAFLEGVALGGATVCLALELPLLGARSLGLLIGAGTGLAYAICNIPWLFAASSQIQAQAGAGASLVAALLGYWLSRDGSAARLDAAVAPRLPGPWVFLLALFLLVWLDSAAFFVIQHNAPLRSATWEGAALLWTNSCVHLGAALISGLLLDRGHARGVLAAAWLLLASGVVLLHSGEGSSLHASVPYTFGVSLYSVVLVWEAARRRRPLHAASLFVFAGWIASGLGIGMARDLSGVPLWFLGVSGGLMLAVFPRLRVASPAARLAVLLFFASLACLPQRLLADAVEGRAVYQSSGCIQCHSQFVRPVGQDVLLYGPALPLDKQLEGAPPLPGNRRLGPDLSNVANRRSREWNRLHLVNPSVLVPGTRMPSYASLFIGNASRGEALLDYLDSLGSDTFEERRRLIASWTPSLPAPTPDLALQARLWAHNCLICHGSAGQADGPLAGKLIQRPPDFTRDSWRLVDGSLPEPALRLSLLRLIKFGRPGSTMPGHEWLDEAALQQLADYVLRLHASSSH